MLRAMSAALAALVVTACAAVPGDMQFNEAATDGLVVIQTTVPDRVRSQFSFSIAQYSPEDRVLTANSFSGWAGVNDASYGVGGKRYVVAKARPGTYVISAVTHQGYWQGCYNGGTVMFDVLPGQVLFLGLVDPGPALFAMATRLPGYTNGQYHYVMDMLRLPVVEPADLPGWQADVAAFLQATHPKVTAPVVAADPTPVTFNTGRSLTGQRVCGGYFAKKG